MEEAERRLLPELVGAELVQKKASGLSFLVQFGYHECEACKAANPGMQAEQEKQGGKIEVYFVDCHNSKNNCGQYDMKSFPAFQLFNYKGGKRRPLPYTSNDYSYDKIYAWAVENSRKPFSSFTDIEALKYALDENEELILITTTSPDIDGAGYTFARDFMSANVMVLPNCNKQMLRELDDTKVGDMLDEDELENVIYCKETCRRFSGNLANQDAIRDFML